MVTVQLKVQLKVSYRYILLFSLQHWWPSPWNFTRPSGSASMMTTWCLRQPQRQSRILTSFSRGCWLIGCLDLYSMICKKNTRIFRNNRRLLLIKKKRISISLPFVATTCVCNLYGVSLGNTQICFFCNGKM